MRRCEVEKTTWLMLRGPRGLSGQIGAIEIAHVLRLIRCRDVNLTVKDVDAMILGALDDVEEDLAV